jgi:PTS system mannose-specific IIA component
VNVGILLVTHGEVGDTLLRAAMEVLGVCPLPTCVLPAPAGCDPEVVYTQAKQALRELDSGDGVLVLTDLYGSTPSNIACRLRSKARIRVVSGLNLPMLIRVLNYPSLDLDELTYKAVTGGRDGVLSCNGEGNTDAG